MKSSILATCKQTRFHLLDDRPTQEVPTPLQTSSLPSWTDSFILQIDVEGLTIAVHSSRDTPEGPSKSTLKGKSKSKPDTRELISDAHLRLKAGVHYGLIGRNGTGKSSKHCFPYLTLIEEKH